MSLTIAGRPIAHFASLPELTRLALGFIDGGREWVGWASTSTTDRFDVPDDTQLVAQVQAGLHISPFALLPALGLMVSPVKLMTLGLIDLGVLRDAEDGADTTLADTQVQRVLAAHRLLTQADLQATQAWLHELQVDTAPVFQAIDFRDRLALHELMSDPLLAGSKPIDNEAAAFAVAQARTPVEFADYFRMYVLASTTLPPDSSPAQRGARATLSMDTLLPLFFGDLDCPQVAPLAAPADVAAAVSLWQAGGQQVGFSRLSEGPALLMRHTFYESQTGVAARQMVKAYVQKAQQLISQVRPTRGRMGQDGLTCTFQLHSPSGDERAVLQLSADGTISLRDYGLQRKQTDLPIDPNPAPAATAPQSLVSDELEIT